VGLFLYFHICSHCMYKSTGGNKNSNWYT
jgi:hypothetical protein